MPKLVARTVVGFVLLACVVPAWGGPVSTAGIPQLVDFDALKETAPVALNARDFSRFAGPPARMVGSLRQRQLAGELAGEIDVFVQFHLPTRSLKGSEALTEDERDRHVIAGAAHYFAARLAEYGFRAERSFSHSALLLGRIDAGRLQELAAVPGVELLTANSRGQLSRTEGAAMISSRAVRDWLGGSGSGIGVAIVDSGVDRNHPELTERVRVWGSFLPWAPDPFEDLVGHGTAVAGIVGGSEGMAPAVSLWAVRVGDDEGVPMAALLAALNALYAQRSQYGGLHVINMSLGFAEHSAGRDCDRQSPDGGIFKKLEKAGIHVVVASGNEAKADLVSWPACHSKVTAVGAVYDANLGFVEFSGCSEEALAKAITCYSNSAPPLDVLAPSNNASTTAPGGGYDETFGGTSAAAPYVSGVIAQILSKRPKVTPLQMRSALMNTGEKIRDPWNGLVRRLINGAAAYQKLGRR